MAGVPNIAVIGAGAVGLSTAVQIQKALPGCKVTIIADRFGRDTTSDGAAGMFRPTIAKTPGTDPALLRSWLRSSWEYFDALAHSPDAKDAGIEIISGYQFFNDNKPTSMEKDFIYDHRVCTDRELSMFPGPRFRHGFRATTMMIECRMFLPYLMKQFRLQNGRVEHRTVKSLDEFVGQYDAVVVCTGFWSKYLLNDDKVYSSRGHLIRVQAPWVKQFIYAEEGDHTTYIYPGADTVVIGGTRQKNEEDLTPRDEDHKLILENACKIMPSLKNANILWDWVGLRPYRQPLRLEKEILQFPNGSLPVVYNYGHGGEGVSLSWGTATHATKLIMQHLANKSKL